jgi:hypothetical protein
MLIIKRIKSIITSVSIINNNLTLELLINDSKNAIGAAISTNKVFIPSAMTQTTSSTKCAQIDLKAGSIKYGEVIPLLKFQIPTQLCPVLLKVRHIFTKVSEFRDKLAVQVALNQTLLTSMKLTEMTIQASLAEIAANVTNVSILKPNVIGKYNENKFYITWNVDNINSLKSNIFEVDADIEYKSTPQRPSVIPIIIKCTALEYSISGVDITVNSTTDVRSGKILKRTKFEYRFA